MPGSFMRLFVGLHFHFAQEHYQVNFIPVKDTQVGCSPGCRLLYVRGHVVLYGYDFGFRREQIENVSRL